ncbi:MAG: hypothetical protein AAGE52_02900 [Myxococcota bacterium]
MATGDFVGRIQSSIDNLNDRERKLLTALGGVFIAIVVLLPLYLVTSSISDIETENEEIASVLRDIRNAQGTLAQRQAEREASAARYGRPAPPLGSFIEARASEQELTLREVTDQPEKVLGDFTRRNVRATMPGVNLRPVVKMFTAIENSPFPVAVERIQIEHFRPGDNYNVQVGVIAFDREQPESGESGMRGSMRGSMRASMRSGMRAGPPAP